MLISPSEALDSMPDDFSIDFTFSVYASKIKNKAIHHSRPTITCVTIKEDKSGMVCNIKVDHVSLCNMSINDEILRLHC